MRYPLILLILPLAIPLWGQAGCVFVGDKATDVGDDDDDDGIEPCAGDDCVCLNEDCDVTCSGVSDCDVQCTEANCDINCNGSPNCDVQGSGTIEVNCSDVESCDVECSTADACDVDCTGTTDCSVTCPADGCTVNGCDNNNCTVVCGFVPQVPANGTVSCN